jgi:glutamyl-tRNA reductase
MHWVQSEVQMQTVRAIRHHAEKLKNETLSQALRRLQKGENPEEVLTHFAHQLTQKLMHQPTLGLKDLKKKSQEKVELVKELFSIE